MRLTLVISSLRGGGAERTAASMANYWARKGFAITLLTFDDGSTPPFYPLHAKVIHHPLGLTITPSGFCDRVIFIFRRFYTLRKAVRKSAPDAVIASMDVTNVRTLLSTMGLKIPALVTEQVDPSMSPMHPSWKFFRRMTYPFAAKIVCVSGGVENYFSWLPQEKKTVIYNPLTEMERNDSETIETKGEGGTKWALAMGRFRSDHQKGFDLLLKAFQKAAPNHPDWNLALWGDGPELEAIRSMRDELGLSERVRIPGVAERPFEEFRRADLFVLSSRYEGFPHVLVEAMACGLPAVSFDCPSGPNEIIRDGIDGVLVPPQDTDALAAAMDALMGDEERRKLLGRKAVEIKQRVGLDGIMAQWERTIDSVVRKYREKT